MIPEEKVIATLLDLESAAHKTGWDHIPATLFLIRAANDGISLETIPAYESLKHVLRAIGISKPEEAALIKIGESCRRSNSDLSIALGAHTQFPSIGALLISEAYATMLPPEEVAGRDLADVPGSVEVRITYAIDAFGRYFYVTRQRGNDPISGVYGTDNPRMAEILETPGAVALLNIVLGLSRSLPRRWRDPDALERLDRLANPDDLGSRS